MGILFSLHIVSTSLEADSMKEAFPSGPFWLNYSDAARSEPSTGFDDCVVQTSGQARRFAATCLPMDLRRG